MIPLSDKIASILPVLEEKGIVYLFAFAERENIDRWDIVLSADWSDKDWSGAVRLIADLLRPRLEPHEKTMIARIAVIPSTDPNMQSLPVGLEGVVPADNKRVTVELLGSDIRSAFIFKAKHPPTVSPMIAGASVEMVMA